MREKAIIDRLYVLRCRLVKAGLKEELRRSQRGVPHVLVFDADGNPLASVAFFGKGRFYRCFHPWPSSHQKKYSSQLPDKIVDHIKKKVMGDPLGCPNCGERLSWNGCEYVCLECGRVVSKERVLA